MKGSAKSYSLSAPLLAAVMMVLTSQNVVARQTTTHARVERRQADSIVLACPPGYMLWPVASLDANSISLRKNKITVPYICQGGKGSEDTVFKAPFIGEDADIKFITFRDYCALSEEQMASLPPGPSVCEELVNNIYTNIDRNTNIYKNNYKTQDGVDCMKAIVKGNYSTIPYWAKDNRGHWSPNYKVGIDDKCRYVAAYFANKMIVARLSEKKRYFSVAGVSITLEKINGR